MQNQNNKHTWKESATNNWIALVTIYNESRKKRTFKSCLRLVKCLFNIVIQVLLKIIFERIFNGK
jgi:hypothetical protein